MVTTQTIGACKTTEVGASRCDDVYLKTYIQNYLQPLLPQRVEDHEGVRLQLRPNARATVRPRLGGLVIELRKCHKAASE